MRIFLLLLTIFLAGCGIPNEKDITNNIDKGIKKIEESSYDESWDHSKNIEDYLHLTKHKYKKEDVKKVNKHLKKLDYSLVVMSKKKSDKEWEKLKKTWEKMRQKEDKK